MASLSAAQTGIIAEIKRNIREECPKTQNPALLTGEKEACNR